MKCSDQFIKIADIMVARSIIPKDEQFLITDDIINAVIDINGELNKSFRNLRPTDYRYHKKLSGLNLLTLNNIRANEIKVTVAKQTQVKQTCGFLYLITNPSFDGFAKIGITRNLEKRLATYQTYDPHRKFSISKCVFIKDCRITEKHVIDKYQMNMAQGEWVPLPQSNSLFKEFENIGNT